MINKRNIIFGVGAFIILATTVLGFWYYKTMPDMPLLENKIPFIKKDRNVLNVKKGDEFTISLDSNLTTGYEWDIEYDSAKIDFKSKEYVPDFPQIIGSGGKETFYFEGLEIGRTRITFNYLRPWEQGKEPEKRINFDIIVE